MKRRLHAIRTRLPRTTLIWAALCVLLGFGMLSTLVDLAATPLQELRVANTTGQRAVVDAHTGAVSGVAAAPAATPFEVSTDEEGDETPVPAAPEAPAATPAEPAPAIDAPALQTQRDAPTLPTLASTHESIVAPPAPEITEPGKQPLPKRGDKGATAASLYAKRFQRQKDTSYLSIVLTDVGFNAATLSQVLILPREVTVAISPYALDPKPQIALLHTAGYETWGMLPAQSARYPQDDPGPLGLLTGQKEAERQKRLKQVMSATLGAVGLVLPPNEAISAHKDFAPVLKEIDARGLRLLSAHPERTLADITHDAALQTAILRADLVLDTDESTAAIQSKLSGLRALARQQKTVVVLASARPHTLNVLTEWLKTEPLGDVKLAPLSAMYAPAEPPPPAEAPAPAAGSGH